MSEITTLGRDGQHHADDVTGDIYLHAEAGSFVVTVGDAQLLAGLNAEAGVYTATISDATLTFNTSSSEPANAWYNGQWFKAPTYGTTWYGPAAASHTLTAEAGTYTVTGGDATFTYRTTIPLSAEAAAYDITVGTAALTAHNPAPITATRIVDPADGTTYIVDI